MPVDPDKRRNIQMNVMLNKEEKERVDRAVDDLKTTGSQGARYLLHLGLNVHEANRPMTMTDQGE